PAAGRASPRAVYKGFTGRSPPASRVAVPSIRLTNPGLRREVGAEREHAHCCDSSYFRAALLVGANPAQSRCAASPAISQAAQEHTGSGLPIPALRTSDSLGGGLLRVLGVHDRRTCSHEGALAMATLHT